MPKLLRPDGTRYILTPTWAYLALACIWLAIGGLQSDPVAGIIIAGGMMALCSPFFVRSGVYVTKTGVRCVPVSGRQSTLEWSSVRGFKVAPAVVPLSSGFGVYAELMDGREILLPTMRGPARYRPKMERICAALDAARARAHSLQAPVQVEPHRTDPAAIRATLLKVRLSVLALGAVGIAAGAGGWLWTSHAMWWGLAFIGAISLAAVVPVQMGLRAIELNPSGEERTRRS